MFGKYHVVMTDKYVMAQELRRLGENEKAEFLLDMPYKAMLLVRDELLTYGPYADSMQSRAEDADSQEE